MRLRARRAVANLRRSAMNESRTSTRTLIAIGLVVAGGSAAGVVFHAYAYHDQRMTLTLMGILNLLVSGIGLGTTWLLDAIRCNLAVTRLRAGDDVKATLHLGRVVMLHRKVEAIRQVYGLRPPDSARPLGL